VWERRNEVVSVGSAGGLFHFFVCGLWVGQPDIVSDRRVKEHRCLRNECNPLAHGAGVYRMERGVIDLNRSALGVIKPRQQFDKSGLAGAARSDQCAEGSRRDVDRKLVQNRSGFVGKNNIVEPHASGHRSGQNIFCQIISIGHGGILGQHSADTIGRAFRFLHVVEHADKPFGSIGGEIERHRDGQKRFQRDTGVVGIDKCHRDDD